ncbi:MAG: hypothetical protein ACE366_18220 [Bradymonadia bacterium]
MKRIFSGAAVALAFLMVTPMGASARDRDIKDALRDVQDIRDELRDEDRRCEEAIKRGIKRVERDLEDVLDRPRLKDAEHAMDDLRDLMKDADRDCGRRVRRKLDSARDHLKDAIRDLEDDRRDDRRDRRDDRRDRRDDRRDEAPAVKQIKVDCWDKSDPGCHFVKNGKHPMGKAAWKGFLQSVKSSSPNVFQMLDQVKSVMGNNYITSKQLMVLVKQFKPNVFQMLDVVKACGPKVVDPQNGLGIGQPFQPNVFQAKDAVKVMSGQAHGKKLDNVVLE